MKAGKSVSVRKGLTDITNSRLPPPSPSPSPQQKFPLTPTSKSHVEKLLQENAALINLIEERDKRVEASGAALQKLSVNFQKLLEQNTTLAKELNAVKDELRVLQHELACKNVVLKARDMEQKEKVQIQPLPLNVATQEEEVEATNPSCDHIIANKTITLSKKQNQQRQILGAPSTLEKEDEKFKVPNTRQSWRRQLRKFQTQEPEPEENLFEIEEAKYPITQPVNMPKPDQELKITCSSLSKEGVESNSCSTSGNEAAKRSSMGRPLRRAAEKIQSYKEIPLNIKMRRMK